MGDREVAASADQIAKAGDLVKKSLDTELKKDKTIDKETRQAIVDEADQLCKDAKLVRDRVKDGKPSSAEAEKLLAGAAKMKSFVESHQVPAASRNWSSASEHLQKLASAYGISGTR
jgi:hypothetical protein